MLLPAANHLQMLEVSNACCDFLQSQLHPSNCLGIRAFADHHACQELCTYAQEYIEQHFRWVRLIFIFRKHVEFLIPKVSFTKLSIFPQSKGCLKI